ncbi:MAG: SRPBCC domain-containing protein [Gemmatimonadaceae bacterium]
MTATAAAPTKADPISVTADTKKGEIYGTADINATPERIFRALTTEEMADWWGQGPYKTTDYKIDLRPGGKWSCKAINPKGDESTIGGEYITIDPPRVLEYTWVPSWDNYQESRVRFEIAPTAMGSRVTLKHTGFAGREEMCNNHTTGWKQVLGWLSGYVSSK